MVDTARSASAAALRTEGAIVEDRYASNESGKFRSEHLVKKEKEWLTWSIEAWMSQTISFCFGFKHVMVVDRGSLILSAQGLAVSRWTGRSLC